MRRTVSRAASRRSAAGEAGIALVTVLWFLVAMSALAVTLTTLGRDSAYASRNAVRGIEVRATMASALEIAAAALWRGRMPTDGRLAWRQGTATLTATATAESGKIDLNAASDELIEALAAVAAEALGRDGQAALAVAHALLDWRDPDRERRLAGAEAADYAGDGGIARPRDGPFRFLAELRSVRGVDQALLAVLAPAVSVHHGQEEPTVEPSSPLARAALDRARGLGLGMAGGESSFDPGEQPLQDSEESAPASAFVADPAGLYTIEIELVHDDGPSFRQQTVIWIDPPLGNARYAVLENRSTILPAPRTDAAAPWPGR